MKLVGMGLVKRDIGRVGEGTWNSYMIIIHCMHVWNFQLFKKFCAAMTEKNKKKVKKPAGL